MFFKAINSRIDIQSDSYGKSNDDFVSVSSLSIIDCSLGTNPFSYLNNIHHSIKFGDVIDSYQYPKKKDFDILKQSILEYYKNPLLKTNNIHLWNGWLVLLERLATKFFATSHIIGIGPQFPYFINDHLKMGGSYTSSELIDGSDFDGELIRFRKLLESWSYDICYIDNPNNPTWFYFDRLIIENIVNVCQQKWMICIIDEAYGSFISPELSALHLVPGYDNLIVLRSYSKGFGLSGARAGYIVCWDELSELYHKIDNGFEPSALSIKMCIEASYHDNFMKQCRINVKSIKEKFLPQLEKLGYHILPNHPNVSIFLMYKPQINLFHYLQERNILTTPGSWFSSTSTIMDNSYVRVLVPSNEELMNEFIRRLSL